MNANKLQTTTTFQSPLSNMFSKTLIAIVCIAAIALLSCVSSRELNKSSLIFNQNLLSSSSLEVNRPSLGKDEAASLNHHPISFDNDSVIGYSPKPLDSSFFVDTLNLKLNSNLLSSSNENNANVIARSLTHAGSQSIVDSPISVTFYNDGSVANPTTTDWIGIYATGADPTVTDALLWMYLNVSCMCQTPPLRGSTPVASGVVTFSSTSDSDGSVSWALPISSYDVIHFSADTFNVIISGPNTHNVVAAPTSAPSRAPTAAPTGFPTMVSYLITYNLIV